MIRQKEEKYMDFYGFEYINQQSNINDYIKYAIIFLALVLFVLLFALYRKNHFQTKYRDLSILFFLILLFMLGIEWTDYQQNQSNYRSEEHTSELQSRFDLV